MRVKWLLVLILFGGFLVRLYGFSNPITDWHSWRQSDTSSVSRNFVKNGFDLLHPRMDNLSNVQSGKDNPEGYFFVEFPVYNATQAGLFMLFDFFTLEEWGRLITIFASLFSALFLYLLVSKHSNQTIGLLSAFFFTFLPFDIYYGRVVLVDSSMVMATLGAIYFFDKWLEKSIKYKVLSIKYWLLFLFASLFTALAFLLKPYAVFFVLPMVYLAFRAFGWKMVLQWKLWLFALISLAPMLAWRTWMTQFPEGIPANIWLLNGNGIRFRPSFFRWIFYERLTILMSGYAGIIFILLSIFQLKKTKEWLFFVSFFVSSLLYVTVFATGNVQHDYYQILIMPSVAIAFAFGSYFLSRWKIKNITIGWVLVTLVTAISFYGSWQQVKEYYRFNEVIVTAGKAVQKLTPPESKVIANNQGDSSFLYQTNRKGWASFQNELPVMIEKGADYLVLVNPTPADDVFKKDYKVVSETKEYVIFNLREKP